MIEPHIDIDTVCQVRSLSAVFLVIAHIAQQDKATIIARGGVGPNAGHTVEVGDKKYGVRMVPSGFVYPHARLMIGSGVLVDPRVFAHELEVLGCRDRTFIDGRGSYLQGQTR